MTVWDASKIAPCHSRADADPEFLERVFVGIKVWGSRMANFYLIF